MLTELYEPAPGELNVFFASETEAEREADLPERARNAIVYVLGSEGFTDPEDAPEGSEPDFEYSDAAYSDRSDRFGFALFASGRAIPRVRALLDEVASGAIYERPEVRALLDEDEPPKTAERIAREERTDRIAAEVRAELEGPYGTNAREVGARLRSDPAEAARAAERAAEAFYRYEAERAEAEKTDDRDLIVDAEVRLGTARSTSYFLDSLRLDAIRRTS